MSQLITIVILCLSNYVFGNNDTLISIISLPNEETVIVDSITIDVINTFENVKTYTAVEKHIYHLGNKIRYKTKKNTIMKYLLFKKGDSVSKTTLIESERNLRKQIFLADAKIYFKKIHEVVIIKVMAFDQWTTVHLIGSLLLTFL